MCKVPIQLRHNDGWDQSRQQASDAVSKLLDSLVRSNVEDEAEQENNNSEVTKTNIGIKIWNRLWAYKTKVYL